MVLWCLLSAPIFENDNPSLEAGAVSRDTLRVGGLDPCVIGGTSFSSSPPLERVWCNLSLWLR